MNKKPKTLIDVLSIALVFVGFSAAAYRFIPPFRAALLMAAGRGHGCTLERALRADAMINEHMAEMRRMDAASRLDQRDDHGLELWDTPKGKYWLPKGQKNVLMSLLAEQQHHIYGEGPRGVQKGDIVLDCGAHVGTFTREALAAGAKVVVAIEPAPANLESLRRNLAAEIESGRVIVVAKGVWNKEGVLPFHVDPDHSASDRLLEPGESSPTQIDVPLTTIDKLSEELRLPRVDFIKMDIEGAETKALAGSRAILAQFKPRLAICAYHNPQSDPVDVPLAVRNARTDYQTECGPCGEQDGRIIPQTYWFF